MKTHLLSSSPLCLCNVFLIAGNHTGRIKVVFTPTICKLACTGSRCHNNCELGNTTTIISENGHTTDTLTAPNFRVVVCHLPCMNGGKCSSRDKCQCPPNFTGKFCQMPLQNGNQEPLGGYTQVHSTHTLPLTYSSKFAPGIVNIHIKHPPEASVQVHQVSQVDNYQTDGHKLKDSQLGSSSSTSYSFHHTESSQKIQHHGYSLVYPGQHGYQIPQHLSVTTKNTLGRCFQETAGSQCGKALPGLTKQEQCCGTVGTSWGFHKCQKCPKKQPISLIDCPQGYRRINSSDCQDLDDCQLQGVCPNGTCVNTAGSYRCICKPGYVPDPTFTTSNTDKPDVQDEKGACFRLVSSGRQCMYPVSTQLSKQLCCCSVGKAWGPAVINVPLQEQVRPSAIMLLQPFLCTFVFGGTVIFSFSSDLEVDECQIDTYICGPGICYNTAKSYTCHCDEGYGLDAVYITFIEYVFIDFASDVDECVEEPRPCIPLGECVNTLGLYYCTCTRGYQQINGTSCNITSCSIADCSCAANVDECIEKTELCFPHGKCHNTEGSYTCVCDSGFTASIDMPICEGKNNSTRTSLLSQLFAFCGFGTAQTQSYIHHFTQSHHSVDPLFFHACSNLIMKKLESLLALADLGHWKAAQARLASCNVVHQCLCLRRDSASSTPHISLHEHEYINEIVIAFTDISYLRTFSNLLLIVWVSDIDECGLDETLCGLHGFCENRLGSFQCLCDQGYQVSQDNKGCMDVNECELLSSVCGEAQCVNVDGSFMCVCPSGQDYNVMVGKCEQTLLDSSASSVERKECYYRLNDENLCESVLTSHVTLQECCCTLGAGWGDNCEVHPCPVNETDHFNRLCPSGRGFVPNGDSLYGLPISYNADECTLFGQEVCEGGFCLDTKGSYECYCKTGQDYDPVRLQCRDIDECQDESICVGGQCLNTEGSYMCFCTHPMVLDPSSSQCVIVPEVGEQHDLEQVDYQGICWEMVTKTQTCTRPLGPNRKTTYTECCCLYGEAWGMDCALCPPRNTDDYASMCNLPPSSNRRPYGHDALVADPQHKYEANPYDAFKGLHVEECGILNGCENGRCVRVQEGYTCDCFDGYTLDLSHMACIDVNECSELETLQVPLCKNAKCINTIGSYRCVCLPGFKGSNKRNYCVQVETNLTSTPTQ
uniref:Latent transforming growth factor beta binding protein 1 n=1 Tax=Gouania willdenowi TaxID=441366 RepID=A0A8C5EPM3_GOUWI